jgi:hypothetical protein
MGVFYRKIAVGYDRADMTGLALLLLRQAHDSARNLRAVAELISRARPGWGIGLGEWLRGEDLNL